MSEARDVIRLSGTMRGARIRVARLAPLLVLALAAATAGAQAPAPSIPDDPPAELRDLPLHEVPSLHAPGAPVAILITGDGGWVEVDRAIGAVLAEHGIGVVALDSRAYLRRRRTPDEMSADVARVASAYLTRWTGGDLVLLGYSRGADVLPFVASRLPAPLLTRTRLIAMLGLASTVNFQFHWADLVHDARRPTDLPVLPELAKLRGTRMLCVYGVDETDSACPIADPTLVTPYARPGGHHFDRDYRTIGELIVAAAR